MGIFSSAESCRETKETVKYIPGFWWGSFFATHLTFVCQHFHGYLNLIHPRSDVKEAAFWSNIVEEQDSMSFTEIGPGNTTKPTAKRNTTLCLVSFIFILKSLQKELVAPYESQYLSCPAVSHICRLVFSPSTSIFFIWKSTPEKQKTDFNVWYQECVCGVSLNAMCLPWHPPSVVWISPLNSLSVSLSRKLDFPAPASPAKTRRYMGAGSSVSSMSASKGFAKSDRR